MDRFVRVRASFDASHHAEGRKRCERNHGHHWDVEVTTITREGESEVADALADALETVLTEWRDRDLNEMIHNFNEITPERLAPWIMERLLTSNRGITDVTVSDGVIVGGVHRELLAGIVR